MELSLLSFPEVMRAFDELHTLNPRDNKVHLEYTQAGDEPIAVTLEEGAVLVFTTGASNQLRVHARGEYMVEKIVLSMNGQPRESKWYKLIEGILTDLEALLARCESKVVHDA